MTRCRLGRVTVVGEAEKGGGEALEALGFGLCTAWERPCDQAKANPHAASGQARDFSGSSCEEASLSDHAVTDVLAP